MFSKIFKISAKFFQIFLQFFFKISTNITQNLLIFAVFSRQFLSQLLTFYQVFYKCLIFKKKDLLRVAIKLQLKFAQIFILIYLKFFLEISDVFNFFFKTH